MGCPTLLAFARPAALELVCLLHARSMREEDKAVLLPADGFNH